ncbi:hypothetical protein Mapa_005258 [Marchantia paleacea]|nr:hypothetical protein Mapa_005258 [Marchantia paleacea]
MTSVHSNHAGHTAIKDRSARSHRVSNPFDSDDDETPQIVTSKVRNGSNSATSSSRFTNPFDDDVPAHSVSKYAPRRSVDSVNPFDDDEPVAVKHVTNGHKAKPSKSGYSSGSGSNPFDDADEVTSKPKSRGDSILDDGSLFDDDERAAKPTKESSSRGFTAKLKAGGTKFVEGGARMRDTASSTLSSVKLPSLPAFSSSSSSHSDEKAESKRGKAKQQMRDLYGEPEPSYMASQQNSSYAEQSRYADQTVEQLEQHAVSKSQDTTSSIKNCVRIAEDTMGVATKTMETLHDQADQIRRTHETALRVDDELSRGEKLLGSLGGMFTKTWKPKKGRPITGPEPNTEQYRRRGQNSGDKDRAGLGLTGNHDQGRRTSNLSGLSGAQAQLEMEREKQDDALTDLSNVLGQLKNMTLDMGNEIERQNGDLDRMSDDVNELNSRVRGANTRTRRLINR